MVFKLAKEADLGKVYEIFYTCGIMAQAPQWPCAIIPEITCIFPASREFGISRDEFAADSPHPAASPLRTWAFKFRCCAPGRVASWAEITGMSKGHAGPISHGVWRDRADAAGATSRKRRGPAVPARFHAAVGFNLTTPVDRRIRIVGPLASLPNDR